MSKLIGVALSITVSLAAITPVLAQQNQAPANEQYVVTYVETIPAQQIAAEQVLQSYIAFGSRQPGVIRFDLEKEAGFSNRYAIRQEWQSAADYTAFVKASQGWTNYLAPFLDAPFDNRLGNFVY